MAEQDKPSDLTTGAEVVSKPISDIESIPPEQVIERLELTGSPRTLLSSVRGSIWGRVIPTTWVQGTLIDSGIVLECRTLSILQQPRKGSVRIYDFDDCLMSSSSWHRREYELLEQSQALSAQGINISPQRAREIYELSKTHVPGVAEKEPRYTPHLNLVLLSIYAAALREGQIKEQTGDQQWNELLAWWETINQQVQDYGERALKAYAVNPDIQSIFTGNSPADFLYADFVQDLLGQTRSSDIRIVATRGKIEGPLGQVYKVHRSGLMRQRSIFG